MKLYLHITKLLIFLVIPLFTNTSCNQTNSQNTKFEEEQSIVASDSLRIMQHFKANKKMYYGIDLSKWNGDLVSKLKGGDSITFVIIKATEGITYIDPMFVKNWKMIRQKQYLLGAYHFYKANDDPVLQAKHFLATIQQQGKTELALIVDIEQGSLQKNNSPDIKKIQTDLQAFLNYLEEKAGYTPMIYTGLYFANKYLNAPTFSKYPLWLAEYSKAESPQIPKTWSKNGWTIWQKSDQYSIESVHTDLDIYIGVLSDLQTK